jgi:hypothetical protein
MFIDFANMSAQADHHRAELLADAENFRLARLVRRAARLRRRDTVSSHPPQPGPAPRNDHAERRYATSR